MQKRILTLLTAMLAAVGLMFTNQAAAIAGDGTSNFYFARSCGNNHGYGMWANISWTNYDNGANQTVHTNITRSGVGIRVEVWINAVFREANDLEDYYSVPGHGKVSVMLRSSPFGSTTAYMNCTRTAP